MTDLCLHRFCRLCRQWGCLYMLGEHWNGQIVWESCLWFACSSMSRLGTWGDHVTLQAAADTFHVGINIITSFLENCVITISPTVDEKQPPDAAEIKEQTEQLKQEQDQAAQGPQEQAMQQLQQAPQDADVPQQLQELGQPTSPLLDDCVTLWLSFWAEVGFIMLTMCVQLYTHRWHAALAVDQGLIPEVVSRSLSKGLKPWSLCVRLECCIIVCIAAPA